MQASPPGIEPAAHVDNSGVVMSGRDAGQRRGEVAAHVPQRAARHGRLAHTARPRRPHAQLTERVVARRVYLLPDIRLPLSMQFIYRQK